VRVEGFQMDEEEDGTDVVRDACWQLGLVRLCSTLRGLGEGDDDGKGIRVVGEVNESVANVAVDGDCNEKDGGCTVSRCRRGLICNRLDPCYEQLLYIQRTCEMRLGHTQTLSIFSALKMHNHFWACLRLGFRLSSSQFCLLLEPSLLPTFFIIKSPCSAS